MRVYLAAPFEKKEAMRELRKRIQLETPHYVTSRWLDEGVQDLPTQSVGNPQYAGAQLAIATDDEYDIRDSGLVVVFSDATPMRGGCMVEMGIALGLGLRVLCVGPRPTVFHYLRRVLWKPDVEALMAFLKSESS